MKQPSMRPSPNESFPPSPPGGPEPEPSPDDQDDETGLVRPSPPVQTGRRPLFRT
jgi:hypothetical protein